VDNNIDLTLELKRQTRKGQMEASRVLTRKGRAEIYMSHSCRDMRVGGDQFCLEASNNLFDRTLGLKVKQQSGQLQKSKSFDMKVVPVIVAST
jgi:hypothetical protein